MKADMEAMKDKMASMMEAMLSMKKIMEVNVSSDKHSFIPYALPSNYTPPNVAHTPNENADNSAPIPIESQQPQFDHAHVSQPMGETHEAPQDHNLVDFEPHLRYATEGQVVDGVPLPNTLGGPQYCP